MKIRNNEGAEYDTDDITYSEIEDVEGADLYDFGEFMLEILDSECRYDYLDRYLKHLGYREVEE